MINGRKGHRPIFAKAVKYLFCTGMNLDLVCKNKDNDQIIPYKFSIMDIFILLPKVGSSMK